MSLMEEREKKKGFSSLFSRIDDSVFVCYLSDKEWMITCSGKFTSFLPWWYLYIYILHSLFLYLPFYDNPVCSFFVHLKLCINIESSWSHPRATLALPDLWIYEALSLILIDLHSVMRFFCLLVSHCVVPLLPPSVTPQLLSVETWNRTSVSKLATGCPMLINPL